MIFKRTDQKHSAIALTPKPQGVYISDKEDTLLEVTEDYGKTQTPDDYLDEFRRFIKDNENQSIALKTLIHQPGKITRAQIKEILLTLDAANFTEKNLRKAWQMKTHKDIAARIVGYVRKAAMGDALVPFEERVDNAVAVILMQKKWNPAQQDILKEIGTLLKNRLAVDEEAINQSALKKKYGPYKRLNKLFDHQLPDVIESINDALWRSDEYQAPTPKKRHATPA